MKDLGTLGDGCRLALGYEMEEAAQRCESTVARADRDATLGLAVLQEGSHFSSREFGQGETRSGALLTCGNKTKEQAPSVTVRTYRVSRDVALLDKTLVKERM
jgi:hypothetical protein